MKTLSENTRNASSASQTDGKPAKTEEKPLSKKAAEMKIFLANNPIPREFLK
jgi:hypothetical protein